MSIETNWFVITGSPSAGKSTTISSIAFHGFKTIPEAARVLIDEELSLGKTVSQIRKDELEFQRWVLKNKISIEGKLNTKEIIFFDRGVYDSIPYMTLAGANPSDLGLVHTIFKYKLVFFLEALPIQRDYARIEDDVTIIRLGEMLYETYKNNGYKVIRIPAMSVGERVNCILSHI